MKVHETLPKYLVMCSRVLYVKSSNAKRIVGKYEYVGHHNSRPLYKSGEMFLYYTVAPVSWGYFGEWSFGENPNTTTRYVSGISNSFCPPSDGYKVM